MKALNELVEIVESETGVNGNCSDHPDDESVGWAGDGSPLPMTFGHVRRARAEISRMSAVSQKPALQREG